MSSASESRSRKLLLCSDLDRTLLPNGPAAESRAARPRLRSLARRPEIALAYVSGRHKSLIREAIERYGLPVPDFAIGDVGTSIYEINADRWELWQDWDREIARDWKGRHREELAALLSDIDALSLQEPEKQNRHKLSYYAADETPPGSLIEAVRERLEGANLQVSVIWSVDELAHVGLLDILPRRATKLHAVRFLSRRKSFAPERVVYAGDSGNDMAVLISEIRSVLVQNASEAVRRQALEQAAQQGHGDRLYLAGGGFMAMNGNYTAGVLEGLAHFFPHTADWMRDDA